MNQRFVTVFILVVSFFGLSCQTPEGLEQQSGQSETNWAEKLGYPVDARVLILHADDMGMCEEANEAGSAQLASDQIQSAAVMVPCPEFEAFADWYRRHPEEDIGLHLTLTAEWQDYRWGPVAEQENVPGLVDPDGFLWRSVPEVLTHATTEEVEAEIRAQVEKALAAGIEPGHLDTHMGTLYANQEYTAAYLKVSVEYGIPAMVIAFTETAVEQYREQGYPITDEMISMIDDYPYPKLNDFYSAPNGESYEDKKQKFMELVRSLEPGITEIIFHPSVESDQLKSITNSWQQRVWESEMFADPEIKQFFEDEGIIFTNWKEMMRRLKE